MDELKLESNTPTVVKAVPDEEAAALAPKPVTNFKKYFPLILFAFIGVIILVEIVYAYGIFATPITKVRKVAQITSGAIVVDSVKSDYQVGQYIPIKIRVSTGGNPSDSADVVIKYDPQILEPGGNIFFQKGSIYPEYPVFNVDSKKGIVRISAITLPNQEAFSGMGVFADLIFKAKSSGQTTIAVDFNKDATSDSNIVVSGTSEDILDQVYDLVVNVVNSNTIIADNSASTLKNNCDGFVQYCTTASGLVGSQFCSGGRSDGKACVWDPKLTTSCTACKAGGR